ncbi:MAG: ribosome maturation factor RimP [Clostridiales bacterium]|nr:ribosome maturation factor RimP [Clostridiales bacterium]
MQNKGKRRSTVDVVREIVEPIASDLGLSIWDVRYFKEGADWYLRVYIDKEGGVSLDDCVDMSRAIDQPLDEADPIKGSYCLEVSSPGVERQLKRDEHFTAMLGKPVKIKLIRPFEGKREFKGTLKAYDKGLVKLVDDEGLEMEFDKKDASSVKLNDFDYFGGRKK